MRGAGVAPAGLCRERIESMSAIAERTQEWWGTTVRFLREVRGEMKKVTWPQRKEVIGSTAVVILASFLVAFFLGAVDLILQKLLGFIVR
jgi:preprotein translocase subunit SecE